MMNRERFIIALPLLHGSYIPQRSTDLMPCRSNPVLNILRGVDADRDIAGRIIGQLDQIRSL